jgi:hypothetical protein
VLIRSERKVLIAGGWFGLREKYCWLMADKLQVVGSLSVQKLKMLGAFLCISSSF